MASRTNMKQEEPDILLSNTSSNQSGSNDFVKKLFQMLQDDGYQRIVRWTKNGDSFVVIDTNEFTKEILPRHFKHSNFASFVRQLNKYDFHKVKISNEAKRNSEYGEDAWEFIHPEFRRNDRAALENIKRKATSNKKNQNNQGNGNNGTGDGNKSFGMGPNDIAKSFQVDTSNLSNQVNTLQESVNLIKQENTHLHRELSILQSKYKSVVDNLVAARSFDERYYNSMNVLVSTLVQAGIKLPPLDFPNPHVINSNDSGYNDSRPSNLHKPHGNLLPQPPPSSASTTVTSGHPRAQAHAHAPINVQFQNNYPHHQRQHSQNSPIRSPNDNSHPMTLPQQASPTQITGNSGSVPTSVQSPPLVQQGQTTPHNEMLHGSPQSQQHQNNQYGNNQTPLPKDSSPVNNIDTTPVNGNGSHAPLPPASGPAPNSSNRSNHGSNRTSVDLPQIITTNIPNPKFHVLLVEDDNVCIQLCRKFLVKYGCQVTVVTDGLNAISTVESTKYDLVLMDIVMPNLDGATATSVIRSFDTKTPIIAMTGNIEDNDLVTYLQNGMSDILAKPFTKDDLYSILTKHLLSSHELQQLSIQQAQDQEQARIQEQQAGQNQSSPTDPTVAGAGAGAGGVGASAAAAAAAAATGSNGTGAPGAVPTGATVPTNTTETQPHPQSQPPSTSNIPPSSMVTGSGPPQTTQLTQDTNQQGNYLDSEEMSDPLLKKQRLE